MATHTLSNGGDNLIVGHGAGAQLAGVATHNTIIGYDSGKALVAVAENTVVGAFACELTAGISGLTVFGFQAAQNAQRVCTAIGYDALAGALNPMTGFGNTAVGYQAGLEQETGSYCTFVGSEAGKKGTANSCTLIGNQAGSKITGSQNTAIGDSALSGFAVHDTSDNVAIGAHCMENDNSVGGLNTAVGTAALLGDPAGFTGERNVVVGAAAGFWMTTGKHCVLIGADAGQSATTNIEDVFVGFAAGENAVAVHHSVAVGGHAMHDNTGESNVAVGASALSSSGTAQSVTAIGYHAFYSLTTGGDYNTAVGFGAGEMLTTGTMCTFVGATAGFANQGSQNTALGYEAFNGGSTDNVTAVGFRTAQLATVPCTALGSETLKALTTGTGVTAVGYLAGTALTTGTDCTLVGYLAGAALTTGALNATALGSGALGVATGAVNCTAVGKGALGAATTGALNATAVGSGAGAALTSATDCTLVGYLAGAALTTGALSATAVGSGALGAATNGAIRVTAIGHLAGGNIATASNCIFVGDRSGFDADGCSSSTIIGVNAASVSPYLSDGVAVGFEALRGVGLHGVVSGNTAVGSRSMQNYTDGSSNTAVGFNALRGAVAGFQGDGNVVIGASTGQLMTISNFNTIVGYNSGASLTTGSNNLLLGARCGTSLAVGGFNIAAGFEAMKQHLGDTNVAIGYKSLAAPGTTTDTIAVGCSALEALTNGGDRDVAVGYRAGNALTTGADCTLVGYQAGAALTSGARHTVMGSSAFTGTGTEMDVTAVGYQAAQLAQTTCTAFGSRALTGDASGMTGDGNTAVGAWALNAVSTGKNAVAVGYRAGHLLTTADDCIAIGSLALSGAVSGINNIAIGSGALAAVTTGERNIAIGVGAGNGFTTGSNNVLVGDSAGYNLAAVDANNTFVGSSAGVGMSGGGFNTSLGNLALARNGAAAADSSDVAIGYQCLSRPVGAPTSVGITAIGYQAGNGIGFGPGLVPCDYCVYIGYQVGLNAADSTPTIRLGNTAGGAAQVQKCFISGIDGVTVGGTTAYVAVIDANSQLGRLPTAPLPLSAETRIANVRGVMTNVADAVPVLISSTDQLGTVSSSIRVKQNVRPMPDAVAAQLGALQPRVFEYKSRPGVDAFGLIAEEVAQVPGVGSYLIARNAAGEIETVKYHELPSLLLKGLQIAVSRVAALEAENATLRGQWADLAARVARLEGARGGPDVGLPAAAALAARAAPVPTQQVVLSSAAAAGQVPGIPVAGGLAVGIPVAGSLPLVAPAPARPPSGR